MEVSENNRDHENIDERDFEKEKPAQTHELVPAEAWQRPAHPHEDKNQRCNFGEENGDVNQSENQTVRAIGDSRKMPASEKKCNNDSRAGDHGDVFAEEK